MEASNGRGTLGHRVADALVRHPWRSLAGALALAAALGPGLQHVRTDFTHRGFFAEDDPLLVEFEHFQRRFGNDEAIVVAVRSASGLFDVESMTLLARLTERMWHVPDVIRVESLTNFNWVHADGDEIAVEPLIPDDEPLTPQLLAERKHVALGHESLPGWLLNRKGDTALVFGHIKPGIERPSDTEAIVTAVRGLLAELATGDHELHVTGGPAVNFAFKESMQGDMKTLVPIVLLLTAVFLFGSFRRPAGVVLPLAVVSVAVMLTIAVSGWLGMRLTNMTSGIPQILVAVGVATAVHVLHAFFVARWRGEERIEAATHALEKNFAATAMTSVTTAVGFFSFATAKVLAISNLGVLAGVGTLLAWLMTYLLMAPLLVLLPIPLGRIREDAVGRHDAAPGAERYVAWVSRNRLAVLVTYVLLSALALWLALSNEINSNPYKYFKEGFPLRAANEFVEAHVGGATGVELVVASGEPEGIKDPAFLRKVEAYQEWLDHVPGITNTVSLLDVLKQTNRSLHGGKAEEYRLPDTREEVAQQILLYTMGLPQGMDINDRVTVQNDALRITVMWTIQDSASAVAAVETMRARGREMSLDVTTTGKFMLYQSMNGYVVDSFVSSTWSATLLISLLLALFLRSLRLGLLAMVPNIVPLILGAAILEVMGQPLDVGTVIVTSVCLGIAVDDTIHFLTHYDRWRKAGHDREAAISRVLTHTLPAIGVTTLILSVSFGAFGFASFVPNRNFGVLTAIILTIGLGIELTLLPALLLSGRRDVVPSPQRELRPGPAEG